MTSVSVDDDMRIPDPWTCRDCVNFARCAALIGVKGAEQSCDWAPHRFRLDTIGVLGRLLEEANATLTLYGRPVSADQLRDFVTTVAAAKIAAALDPDA